MFTPNNNIGGMNTFPTMPYAPTQQDERVGFLGPFLLGGITGGLVAPFFYGGNNYGGGYGQPYYTNNYYYPPYPYYGPY